MKQSDTCPEHKNMKRRDLGDGWNRCTGASNKCKHTRPNSHKKEA